MTKKVTRFLLQSLFPVLIIVAFACKVSAQQSILLYYEDFNGGTSGFTLNNASSVSNGTGNNQWIINNNYTGGASYPNTPDENQVVGGSIAGAPYSNYLHVHDAASGVVNANYNPNNSSDRMAVMNTSFCTLGLEDVTLTFFYIGEGNANDNCELYYSLDGGGTWTQTGQSAYYNQNLWKYEVVTDPAFDNQIDIRFGWRWKNGTGATPNIGFGIDDIIVVGTYDDVNNPVTVDITSLSPVPVCRGGYLFISFSLSAPLCEGTYEIELSNASGSFASPLSLGVFTIGSNQSTGTIAAVIPSTITTGNCYKIRINRLAPPPAITGTASICFQVIDCPNIITTLQPVVTYGPDTVCIRSVIDVPFYSTGVYNFNNQYVAELSDMTGSFASPYFIGSVPDPNTYDPAMGSPPGSVGGIVPTVPEGCGYYVRVRSTNPVAIGSAWGPFCIHECDVTTNNMQDMSVCISDNVGVDTTITVDINTWGTSTTYNPGNEFKVQILHSQYYTILNTGDFGTISSTTSCTMPLNIPGLLQVINLLGPPGTGMYYMRVIATDPVPASDSLGSLVHLTIGSPDSIPPAVFPDDTLVCAGDVSGITIFPFDPNSQYEWYSPQFNFGQPFFWEYNPLLIDWSGAPTGTYWLTVREYNYGCWGPWSDTVYIDVISTPSANVIGTSSVCEGDTVEYHTGFLAGTYYSWSFPLGTILDTANNEVTVVFDSAGIVNLSVFALNECGSNSGSKNITVHPKPEVAAPPDITICPGVLVTLNAVSNATNLSWYGNGSLMSTSNPVDVFPLDTTEYVVKAVNNYGCERYDTTLVTVFPQSFVDAVATDITCNGLSDGTAVALGSGGVLPYVYEWTTNPIVTDSFLTGLAAGNYTVYLFDANGCMDTASVTINEPAAMSITTTSTSESFFGAGDGTATALVAGGSSPYSYEWNTVPPQYTDIAINLSPGTYIVIVTDANGCLISDTVEVIGVSNVFAIPNVFSPNGDGLNDIFIPNQMNVSEFEMRIYNRWGQLLFITEDINEGWDGRFNGKQEEIGTYVYILEATFLNGQDFEHKGNVILLR